MIIRVAVCPVCFFVVDVRGDQSVCRNCTIEKIKEQAKIESGAIADSAVATLAEKRKPDPPKPPLVFCKPLWVEVEGKEFKK